MSLQAEARAALDEVEQQRKQTAADNKAEHDAKETRRIKEASEEFLPALIELFGVRAWEPIAADPAMRPRWAVFRLPGEMFVPDLWVGIMPPQEGLVVGTAEPVPSDQWSRRDRPAIYRLGQSIPDLVTLGIIIKQREDKFDREMSRD